MVIENLHMALVLFVMKNIKWLLLVILNIPCLCLQSQVIWYDGSEVVNKNVDYLFYVGADVGVAINENKIISDVNEGLRILSLDEKLVPNFYIFGGIRKQKHSIEGGYGYLANQFRLQTPRGIGSISAKDYSVISFRYYYQLLRQKSKMKIFAGAGVNLAFLPQKERTFGDGKEVIWISQEINCSTCPVDSFYLKWDPVTSRTTTSFAFDLSLKTSIPILKKIQFSIWQRAYLWTKREVIVGEVITQNNGQPSKTSLVNSLFPIYSIGAGLSWNFGKK
ncbi:MAG: hypothetical protein HY842_20235 [Bacteroidetes bacterium]|nr:hypothetical protein [Bacteroidota bacterium]